MPDEKSLQAFSENRHRGCRCNMLRQEDLLGIVAPGFKGWKPFVLPNQQHKNTTMIINKTETEQRIQSVS